jgi:hypothetical protein
MDCSKFKALGESVNHSEITILINFLEIMTNKK